MSDTLAKLISKKEYDRAFELCQNMHQKSSEAFESAKIFSNMSSIMFLNGKCDESIKYAQDAIELRPDWFKPYYRLAKTYEALGKYEQMIDNFEKMYERLDDEAKDDKSCTYMQDYYNKNVNFMRSWIVASGGYVSADLLVQYYDVDYRGVIATKRINSGQALINVPLNCVLSLHDSKISNPHNAILVANPSFIWSSHTYLAIELLRIKKFDYNNPRYSYIRCLPQYYDNVPINFKLYELRQLDGSYAIHRIFQKLYSLYIEYIAIVKIIPDFPYNFNEYCWARTAVITRVYAITRDSVKNDANPNGEDNVMVPFADMANHETPPNTHWGYDNSIEAFVVNSNREILMNSPIYETYGFKSNYRYFVNYGFTVKNNKHELVGMRFDKAHENIFLLYVSKLYESYNHTDSVMDAFRRSFDGLQSLLMQILNSKYTFEVGYTYDEMVVKMFKYLRGADSPYDKTIEIKVHNSIINTATTILNNITDDNANEFINISEFNVHNINTIKDGERKVLSFWIEFSKHCINIINDQTQVSVRKLNKKMKKYGNIASFNTYIDQLLKLN